MKTRLGLIFAAVVGVLVWFAVPTAQAQPSIQFDDQVSDAADTVLNGTVISTTNVEIDGFPHRVSQVRVTSTLQGVPVADEILVEVPGGQRADGSGVLVSHTANLEAGRDVQLAVRVADPLMQSVLPAAVDLPLVAYSIVGGDTGAVNLLPAGVSVASATGDFSVDGVSWPDFTSPLDFYVNPSGSNLSTSAALSAVRAGFALWEADPASLIDFNYAGQTSAVRINHGDNRNSVSWVNFGGSSVLAQAHLQYDTTGVIHQFDIRINRNFQWSNGAAAGSYDVATVVAHEVGHGLGFNHVDPQSELMYFQVPRGTTKGLGLGDLSGARTLYPELVRSSSFSQSSTSLGIATEAGDEFGRVVVSGDFNNDGRDDFAIGAPGENGDAGMVVIAYRTSSGFTFAGLSQNSPGISGGGEAGDRFAEALAAGDFDGDGYDDLAIGVPGEGLSNTSRSGLVNVLYGGGGGLSSSGSDSFHQDTAGIPGGAESGDRFGASLAAGDFNNDGRDDLAVGVPGEGWGSSSNTGVVQVLRGASDGLTTSGTGSFSQSTSGVPGSSETGDQFGAVLAAGDFDGDGRDDLAVGSPTEALGSLANAGMLTVLYGTNGGLTGSGSDAITQSSPGVAGGPESGDRFASALAAGDFDGDGRDDLAVGVPSEALGSLSSAGMVHVLYGASSGLSGSGSQTIDQGTPGVPGAVESSDRFGASLSVGDVNGNGRIDLVVGSPGERLSGRAGAGMVHVVYSNGSALTGYGSTSYAQVTNGIAGTAETGDQFGFAVAVGDIDGDGCADVLAGVKGENANGGLAAVLYGAENQAYGC